jgi:hypothetical protein
VADSNQPAAVLALNQLRGHTPVVWMITALVAVLSLAVTARASSQRRPLARRISQHDLRPLLCA